jgi:hypothetical protein
MLMRRITCSARLQSVAKAALVSAFNQTKTDGCARCAKLELKARGGRDLLGDVVRELEAVEQATDLEAVKARMAMVAKELSARGYGDGEDSRRGGEGRKAETFTEDEVDEIISDIYGGKKEQPEAKAGEGGRFETLEEFRAHIELRSIAKPTIEKLARLIGQASL